MRLVEVADKYLSDKGSVADMGDGPHNYCDYYERLFEPLRDKAITLFEIGIWEGASLKMWREWFPKATIVGLDLAHVPVEGCHTLRGDQGNAFDLARAAKFGPFDVVIDDGSHIFKDHMASFFFLFPFHMNPGGIYVIEDLMTRINMGRTREFFAQNTPKLAADLEFACQNQVVTIRAGTNEPSPDSPC